MNTINAFVKGSTGNAVGVVDHADGLAGRIAVEFEVEAAGATPTVTFAVEGTLDGTNWVTLALVQGDATVASSNAPITVTAVGKTFRWIDGLALRFFSKIRVNVTANTNITYSARLHTPSAAGLS